MSVRLGSGDTVYPRVCGGTRPLLDIPPQGAGLSPRMRGNPGIAIASSTSTGSIPAYAGEPRNTLTPSLATPVYPRVCGGTSPAPARPTPPKGLSPRMRGNRQRVRAAGQRGRSIPAYAGEPLCANPVGGVPRVYPRVCGGTTNLPAAIARMDGLSPRMRGNHGHTAVRQWPPGSIPAYAGEPAAGLVSSGRGTVYPRVCGGTGDVRRDGRYGVGLSPRMRGNRPRLLGPHPQRRSIPAYAGEPAGLRSRPIVATVYPRVCGGTPPQCPIILARRGLSPRMRGNPIANGGGGLRDRSIPAYAGEPGITAPWRVVAKVYPRVCGGTLMTKAH